MNFKRVLTMLLALCLVVNMAVPGVSALTAGQDNYVAGQNPTASAPNCWTAMDFPKFLPSNALSSLFIYYVYSFITYLHSPPTLPRNVKSDFSLSWLSPRFY